VLYQLPGQRVQVIAAPEMQLPSLVDSNSPAIWQGDRLRMAISANFPYFHSGASIFELEYDWEQPQYDPLDHFPFWIESMWQDPDGPILAWYHHEPETMCSPALTSPEIGALVSIDGGKTFVDLGIVLAAGDVPDCSSRNGFFASGHGDFSVILDRESRYFYFFFGNYGGAPEHQGIAVARLAYENRFYPAGNVWKFRDGDWYEPGIGGQVTPVFQAKVSWQAANTDSFWGPSVHFNTALNSYVMLLNRACCAPRWPQEGVYFAENIDLANPLAWTTPERILSARDINHSPGYYVQVIGLGPGETDTLAGEAARLFVKGISKWELLFTP
jgi:hypothetical protein